MKAKVFQNTIIQAIVFTVAIAMFSCESLDVSNPNMADIERSLEDPEVVKEIAASAYQIWYNSSNAMFHWVHAGIADQITSSWADCGMWDLSKEPRTSYNNNWDNPRKTIYEDFWYDQYAAIAQVNDVLEMMHNGMELYDDTGKAMDSLILAWNYFIRGLAHGNIALFFNKGFYIDSDTDLQGIDYLPYSTLMDSAILLLEKADEICDSTQFVLPDTWIYGESYDQNAFSKIINSYIARYLVCISRNKIQNDTVDWQQILNYAEIGLTFDLSPVTGSGLYRGEAFLFPNWTRIDYRIINLMDPEYPPRWPASNDWRDVGLEQNEQPGEAESDDARLESDFEYISTIDFLPERGYYFFSHYRLKRFDSWLYNQSTGPRSIFLKAENDLIIAEAKLRIGDKAGAISILNDPTFPRKARGNLPDIAADASDEAVLEAIFYERDIELIYTDIGLSFFDMRRRDMLQKGSILHMPVPVIELILRSEPGYTFGGTHGVPGEDYSIGGWF